MQDEFDIKVSKEEMQILDGCFINILFIIVSVLIGWVDEYGKGKNKKF